jgi:rubredoxin
MIKKCESIEDIKKLFDSDYPPSFDAEFSPQTIELAKSFNAKGVHLNKWWVMTAMGWKCPACLRTKPQIVKLDSKTYLSCLLHEHHDHMKDIVRRLFEESSSNRDEVVANVLGERFAVRTSFAISAYDNTVICSDCNKADGVAKKLIKAHKDFSFSPDEIGKFILIKNNEEHEIDQEVAKKIWLEGQDTFNKRLKLGEYIAELAASDSHWYQPSEITAKKTKDRAYGLYRQYGLDQLTHDLTEKLLYNPVPFKGNHTSWRLSFKPIITKKPTGGEIAHLANTRGHYWKQYDDEWSCPCCSRSKYDCVQPSKRNPWVFEVKSFHSHDLDKDVYYKDIKVCNECFNTAYNLCKEALEHVKERVDVDFSVDYLHCLVKIEELQSIVQPRNNSSHFIENELVDGVIKKLIDRIINEDYSGSKKHREILELKRLIDRGGRE